MSALENVGLHQHSEHSFLDGLARTEEIVCRAKEMGQQATSITDHGECGGHLEFLKHCKQYGIKGLLGMEGYWVPDLALKKEIKNSHITLIAANKTGLSNLWALSSDAYQREYFFKKPLADPALLKTYAEGIYASDGCMLTDFGRAVEADNDEAARRYLGTLLNIFGDRFFMELHTWQVMEPNSPEDYRLNALMSKINQAKVQFATEMGVPLVVVNDSHHAYPTQWHNRALVVSFNTKGNMDDVGDPVQKADHMMPRDELFYWMSQHGIGASVVEEAIANANAIAEACEEIDLGPTMDMPRLYETDADDIDALITACEEGFKAKVLDRGKDFDAYYARMESELQLIVDKGFAGYFNVVSDCVTAARTGKYIQWLDPKADPDPMTIGVGRGSAGGCLVSYLIGITGVDPLKYGLLFERFLSPGRKGYPDIDVDYPRSKRPLMKQYARARFGEEHTCMIGTRQRNQPAGMLKDLCRVYDIPWTDRSAMADIIDEAAELIAANRAEHDEDQEFDLPWDMVLAQSSSELAPYAQRYGEMFGKLGEMIGLARQSSVHAAGVLISRKPLRGRVPLRVKNDTLTTQFDMNEVEELGAVKLDFLGLRHLDTIHECQRLIKERHGIELDYEQFDETQFNDPAIWGQIDAGDTLGIFQIETPLATGNAMEFKPRSLEDVAALVAVGRPGVIDAGLLDVYLARRAGEEPPAYEHPMMEPYTGESFGVLIYQEQMIRACQDLANFTPDEADDLRKFIGKKKADKLAAMKDRFVGGCLGNYDFMYPFIDPANSSLNEAEARRVAERIWASFEASGAYAFNKSHAVEYGWISSAEVWFKHYYFPEFITALLITDEKKTVRYVREARRRGISVLPPDVNLSGQKFTLHDEGIRYGLDSLRGVGESAAQEVLAQRPFASLNDFLDRTTGRGANRRNVVNALISIGAFDSLGPSRSLLMQGWHMWRILSQKTSANKVAKMSEEDKVAHVAAWLAKHKDDEGFFREFGVPDFDDDQVIYGIEKQLVGTFITIDPMANYYAVLDADCIRAPIQMRNFARGDAFNIGGQIMAINPTVTKRGRNPGQAMAHLEVEWQQEIFKIVVFPEAWASHKHLLAVGAPVYCTVLKLDRGCCLSSAYRLDWVWQEVNQERTG